MPRNRTQGAIQDAYNLGASVNRMRMNGLNSNNAGLFGKSARGLYDLFKKRKGGIIQKKGVYHYVAGGGPPNSKEAFDKMTKRQKQLMYQANNAKVPNRGKTRRGTRKRGGRNTGARKAPSAAKLMNMTFKAARANGVSINTMNTSSATISHVEVVDAIVGNGLGTNSPAIYIFGLNPGLGTVFRWGGPVMSNWMYYLPLQLIIRLTSTCASTTTGRWAAGFDYNPYFPTNTITNINLITTLHSVMGDVKDHLTLTMNMGYLPMPSSKLQVRTGNVPTGLDTMQFDMGNLYIGVETQSDQVIGQFSVAYSFAMSDAVPVSEPHCSYLTTGTITPTIFPNCFANATEKAHDSPVVYSRSTKTIDNEDGITTWDMRFVENFRGILVVLYQASEGSVEEGHDFATPNNMSTVGIPLICQFTISETASNFTFDWFTAFDDNWVCYQVTLKAYAGDVLSFYTTEADATYTSALLTLSDNSVSPISPNNDPSNIQYNSMRLKTTTKLVQKCITMGTGETDEEDDDDEIIVQEQTVAPPKNKQQKNVTFAVNKKLVTKIGQVKSSKEMAIEHEAEQGPLVYFLLMLMVVIVIGQIRPPTPRPIGRPTTRKPTLTAPTFRPTQHGENCDKQPGLWNSNLILSLNKTAKIYDVVDMLKVNQLLSKFNTTHMQFNDDYTGIVSFIQSSFKCEIGKQLQPRILIHTNNSQARMTLGYSLLSRNYDVQTGWFYVCGINKYDLLRFVWNTNMTNGNIITCTFLFSQSLFQITDVQSNALPYNATDYANSCSCRMNDCATYSDAPTVSPIG